MVTLGTGTPGVGVRLGQDGAQSVVTGPTGNTSLDRAISNNTNRSSGGGSSRVSRERLAAAQKAAEEKARKEAEAKEAAKKAEEEAKRKEKERQEKERLKLMSASEKLRYYYENLDIKSKGFLPGGITPEESRLRDNREKINTYENWFGGQPTPEVNYFGDKQLTSNLVTIPTLGGSGTNIVQLKETEDIKPDYSSSIIRKVEEKIPIAGIPITSLDKNVYVPDAESFKKYGELIESGNAVKLNKFLADQEAQLKKDIGAYNLAASIGDIEKANELAYKINQGQQGTTFDILRGAAKEREEPLKLLGGKRNIDATTAVNVLFGLTQAYEAEKEVLAFQVGGSLAGSILGRSATGVKILTGVEKVSRPFNKLVVPFGLSAGVYTAEETYQETGDLGFSLAGGIGTSAGFLGAVYSKQIVESVGKTGKNIGKFINEYFLTAPTGEETLYFANVPVKTKVKTKQVQVKKEKVKVSGDEIVDWLKTNTPTYNDKAQKVRTLLNELRAKGNLNRENVDRLTKLLRESYGDDFVRDFLVQEGLASPTTIQPKTGTNQLFGIQDTQPLVTAKTGGKVTGRVFSGLLTGSSTVTGLDSRTESRSALDFGVLSSSLLDSRTQQDFRQDTKQGQESVSNLISGQITQPPQVQQPNPIFGGSPSPSPRQPEPRRPEPKIPQPFGFGLPERKKKKENNRPYDAEVYRDATKGRKARWEKVADNVPLVTALSKGAVEADETASNRFRVVPQKGKINQVIDKTWEQLQGKFREYTKKGGVKVGLRPRNYIENRAFRLDNPRERREVQQTNRPSISRKFGRL